MTATEPAVPVALLGRASARAWERWALDGSRSEVTFATGTAPTCSCTRCRSVRVIGVMEGSGDVHSY
jgi:hypothetical protein